MSCASCKGTGAGEGEFAKTLSGSAMPPLLTGDEPGSVGRRLVGVSSFTGVAGAFSARFSF
jgi:hypothetical protein